MQIYKNLSLGLLLFGNTLSMHVSDSNITPGNQTAILFRLVKNETNKQITIHDGKKQVQLEPNQEYSFMRHIVFYSQNEIMDPLSFDKNEPKNVEKKYYGSGLGYNRFPYFELTENPNIKIGPYIIRNKKQNNKTELVLLLNYFCMGGFVTMGSRKQEIIYFKHFFRCTFDIVLKGEDLKESYIKGTKLISLYDHCLAYLCNYTDNASSLKGTIDALPEEIKNHINGYWHP